jgi:hypothetical protein
MADVTGINTATSKKEKREVAKKTLRGIRIESAANGYVVECDYRKDDKDGEQIYDYENRSEDRHLFKTVAEVSDFIAGELKEMA